MQTVTVSPKYQVVIPKLIRENWKLLPVKKYRQFYITTGLR